MGKGELLRLDDLTPAPLAGKRARPTVPSFPAHLEPEQGQPDATVAETVPRTDEQQNGVEQFSDPAQRSIETKEAADLGDNVAHRVGSRRTGQQPLVHIQVVELEQRLVGPDHR